MLGVLLLSRIKGARLSSSEEKYHVSETLQVGVDCLSMFWLASLNLGRRNPSPADYRYRALAQWPGRLEPPPYLGRRNRIRQSFGPGANWFQLQHLFISKRRCRISHQLLRWCRCRLGAVGVLSGQRPETPGKWSLSFRNSEDQLSIGRRL